MKLIEILAQSGLEIEAGLIKLPSWCRRIKVDVGLSTDASQSAKWLEVEKDLIVFGFEPVNRNLEILKSGEHAGNSNFVRPSDIGVRMFVIPVGLASFTGNSTIFVTKDDPGCSSLLKPRDFQVSYEEDIQVFTLNDFFDLFPWHQCSYIDHLKTDCQGMDIDVLKGGSEYLNRIVAITSEAEDAQYLQSQNSFVNILEFLEPYGFKPLNPPTIKLSRIARYVPFSFVKKIFRRLFSTFRTKRIEFSQLKIEVEDPTFLNIKLVDRARFNEVQIYQRG